jgi:hypothetical protein
VQQYNTILGEIITSLETEFGTELNDIFIERAVFVFFTGVKTSTGNGGLSFPPIKEILRSCMLPQFCCGYATFRQTG